MNSLKNFAEQGYEIIYLDEVMFTSKTHITRAWSPKNINFSIDQKKLNHKALAVIAAISENGGLEHLKIFRKSVDQDKFVEWLEEFRELNEDRKVVLFMDQLRVHKTHKVVDKMVEFNI